MHSVCGTPCSQALPYGVEKIGAMDGNQKNEVLAEQGQEVVHVQRVENCAKLIRMKAPAQTYVEGFLCRFFQVKLLAASHCLPSPICQDLTQESLISYSSFPQTRRGWVFVDSSWRNSFRWSSRRRGGFWLSCLVTSHTQCSLVESLCSV